METEARTVHTPASGQAMVATNARPLPWEQIRELIEAGDTYWVSTVRPDGRPHTVPILAVWANDALHFAAGETTRKARNLAWNAHCAIALQRNGFDITVEGKAIRACDDGALRRIAQAYASKYGWRVTVRDGAFHDTEGAPTAGPPPYEVYRVEPTKVFAFGTDDETMAASTRWRF